MFAPNRTLLHTYNRHDDDDDDEHHHHIITSKHNDCHTLKFATPYEQYVGWGNNINFIFMRDQNSPAGDGGVWVSSEEDC